jgi:hypothetical protein
MDEDFKSELEWAEERLGDLVKYTQGDAFKKLSAVDQDLIVQQASALNTYKDIVSARAGKAKK